MDRALRNPNRLRRSAPRLLRPDRPPLDSPEKWAPVQRADAGGERLPTLRGLARRRLPLSSPKIADKGRSMGGTPISSPRSHSENGPGTGVYATRVSSVCGRTKSLGEVGYEGTPTVQPGSPLGSCDGAGATNAALPATSMPRVLLISASMGAGHNGAARGLAGSAPRRRVHGRRSGISWTAVPCGSARRCAPATSSSSSTYPGRTTRPTGCGIGSRGCARSWPGW